MIKESPVNQLLHCHWEWLLEIYINKKDAFDIVFIGDVVFSIVYQYDYKLVKYTYVWKN